MKKMILIISVLFIVSCEEYDLRLSIENKVDKEVFFVITNDYNFKDNVFNVPFSKELPSMDYVRKLEANSLKRIPNYGSNFWLYYITKPKEKKLNVYLFTKDVLLNNSWKSIYENKLFYKHIEQDILELEKNRRKVTI